MSGVLRDCISGHRERLEHGEVVHSSERESGELGWVWLVQVLEGLVGVLFWLLLLSQ